MDSSIPAYSPPPRSAMWKSPQGTPARCACRLHADERGLFQADGDPGRAAAPPGWNVPWIRIPWGGSCVVLLHGQCLGKVKASVLDLTWGLVRWFQCRPIKSIALFKSLVPNRAVKNTPAEVNSQAGSFFTGNPT